MGRSDWLGAGGFGAVALAEGIARPNLPGQPYVTVLAVALMPLLLWRRSRPLLTCLIGFGIAGLLSLVQWFTRSESLGLASMTVVLVLLYTLLRWGSGREITLGMAFVAAVVALGMAVAAADLTTVLGGSLLLLLFAGLGALLRYRADLWQRQLLQIRSQERLELARELHDTVAHHVSAIAVQAQAGGVVAGTQPESATKILAAIEAEASRTLEEMRAMVRVLREDGSDGYAPGLGVADLPALARSDATPTVTVSCSGPMAGLPRQVDAAIFRLAQEALTNAVRHARGAALVQIDVRRVGDQVWLRVVDDGLTPSGPRAEPGFGLTGMAERAHLLGGSLSAGPGSQRGWVVEAVLPAEAR